MSKKEKIILVVELIILLVVCVPLFGKKTEFDFGSDVIYESFDDGYSQQSIHLDEMKPGCYVMEVEYYADNYDDRKGNIEDYVGHIYLDYEYKGGVRYRDLGLNEGKTTASVQFWLKPGFKFDDLAVRIKYDGYGEFNVYSIKIYEKTIYRLTVVLGMLLLFGFIDLIYFIFRDGILTEKKKIGIVLALMVFGSGILCFTDFINYGHDMHFHIARIGSLAQGLKDGQFPNRIQNNMLNGHSYINPLMYGELFLYVPAILLNMGVPLYTCYHIYQLLVNLMTCLIAYYCITKMTGEKKYGVLGAFLTCFSAYRLANFYVRSAVGEYTAFAFFPVIVYGFYKIYSKEKDAKITFKDYMPLVIGISGVLQSHILSTEMIALFIIAFVLINYKKTFALSRFVALVKTVVFIILLNLWFLVPFLQSMRMDLKVFTKDTEYIQHYGAYLSEVFTIFHTSSGFSYELLKGDLPLPLGASLIIGLLAFSYVLLKRKSYSEDISKTYATHLYVMGVISIIFSFKLFPWDAISNIGENIAKVVGVIQFPWRYLTIASVCMIFVTVYVIKFIEKNESKKIADGLVIAMVVLSLASASWYFTDYENTQDEYTTNSIYDFDNMMVGSGCEYMLDEAYYYDFKVAHNYDYYDCKLISQTYNKGVKTFECTNVSDYASDMILPVQNYDNYHVYDEKTGEEYELSTGENGDISIELPGHYNGKVILRYEVPALWRVCEVISLLTLIGLIVWWRKDSLKKLKTK